jgi:uncharacterized membrane protein
MFSNIVVKNAMNSLGKKIVGENETTSIERVAYFSKIGLQKIFFLLYLKFSLPDEHGMVFQINLQI